VPVKEPGCSFPMTFSFLLGVSSENSSARGVDGVKTGAPSGVLCTMWTRGAESERYFSRRVEMALRVDEILAVFRCPSAYLSYVRVVPEAAKMDILILSINDDEDTVFCGSR
jgi:hypothetical protein